MKWFPNKIFPYPVLSPLEDTSNRDYVNQNFQAGSVLEINKVTPQIKLSITCQLSEESLLSLIKNGKAKYATQIHCPSTFLRHLVMSDTPSYSETFKMGDLHRDVEISSYVVCTEDITAHTSHNLHSDFGKDARFDFQSGHILAIDHPEKCYVDPDLMDTVGTIFDLTNDDKQEKGRFAVILDSDSENIQIRMHSKDAEQFNTLQANSDKWPSLLASVFLPTVVYILKEMIGENAGDYADKRWFKVIEQELGKEREGKKKGYELDENLDIMEAAQMLLENPIEILLGGTSNG